MTASQYRKGKLDIRRQNTWSYHAKTEPNKINKNRRHNNTFYFDNQILLIKVQWRVAIYNS